MKKYLIAARQRLAEKAYKSGDFRRSPMGAQKHGNGGQMIVHYAGVVKYSDHVDGCAQAYVETDFERFIGRRVFKPLGGITIRHDFFAKELKKAREHGAPRSGIVACMILDNFFDMRLLDLFAQTLSGDIKIAQAFNYPLIKLSGENGEAYVLGLRNGYSEKIYSFLFGEVFA